MFIFLQNDFHKTKARVRVKNEYVLLTTSQYSRAMRKLCGTKGCQCGGLRGVIKDELGDVIDYTYQFVDDKPTIELLGYDR